MNIDRNQLVQENNLLCVSCKTFFGNQTFGRMCSQCYKKHNIKSQIKPVESDKVDQEMVQTPTKIQKKEQEVKIDKTRCFDCNKKLGLLGVQCRCGKVYCNGHRLPEDHFCSFNHKGLGKQKLTKENIKIQNGKIQKI